MSDPNQNTPNTVEYDHWSSLAWHELVPVPEVAEPISEERMHSEIRHALHYVQHFNHGTAGHLGLNTIAALVAALERQARQRSSLQMYIMFLQQQVEDLQARIVEQEPE